MKLVIAALVAFSFTASAYAHDFWSNGEPVPRWIKRYCCSENEVHRIDPAHVHITVDGYVIDGYPTPIPRNRTYVSGDNSYWAFFSTRIDGTLGTLWCFFAPPAGA